MIRRLLASILLLAIFAGCYEGDKASPLHRAGTEPAANKPPEPPRKAGD